MVAVPGHDSTTVSATPRTDSGLARELGPFDTVLMVLGGIIGASIFVLPATIARLVQEPGMVLLVWVVGGIFSLFGSFTYAELAARMPLVGGQYVYLREAFHPALAFMYGWCMLLVTQTGAIASVAVVSAHYLIALTHLPVRPGLIICILLPLIALINCLGVRSGGTTQNVFAAAKIAAFAVLIVCGWLLLPEKASLMQSSGSSVRQGLLEAMLGALPLVLFSYGGIQRIGYIAGEIRNPERNLPRGILLGFAGVVSIYLLVNIVCIRSLGIAALSSSMTPVSDVMGRLMGRKGMVLIDAFIVISALGWLSQVMLTAPRVYFAMAQDGVFFKSISWLHPRFRVPVMAIMLQCIWAIIIALSGSYEQIIRYVMAVDLLFFALTALSVFIFRWRDKINGESSIKQFRVPGHPVVTGVVAFVAVSLVWLQLQKSPGGSLIGFCIALAGLPVYYFWSRQRQHS